MCGFRGRAEGKRINIGEVNKNLSTQESWGFPGGLDGSESACNTGD